MIKLCIYEWKKLFRQRSFLLFTILLLFGNLFTLFQYEKNSDNYQNFFQQKQNWQKFSDGDSSVPNAEYYQAITEDEKNYVESYGYFLKQIPEQAEQLKQTGYYQNHSTYLYRNLQKTVSDYRHLSDKNLKPEPSIGVKELASYHYGIYFQIIFLFVVSYFVISAERKKGLFLLTKGTRQGHVPLAAAKLLTMVSAGVLYDLLQELGIYAMLGQFYGYGDITRKIQSVSIFRDCSAALTVGEAMGILLMTRLLIGMLCTLLIFCLSISLRQEGAALLIYAAIISIEAFLYYKIELNGSLNMAKCVNIFFPWDMENLLGIYLNLNILGYPVGKSLVTFIMGCIFASILVFLGLHCFSASCQISSGNLLEELRERFARLLSFQWHHTSVYLFEFRKVFFLQKRWCVFLFLLIWCIFCIREVTEPPIYANPEEGEYHRILSHISGRVTEKTLNYVADQRKEIDAIYEELAELKDKLDMDAEFRKDMLMHELEMRDGGVGLVEQQRDLLQEKKGELHDKLWLDEKNYINVFYNYKYDLIAFLMGTSALILWMSEVESADDRKDLPPLLYATKAGKRQIWKKKRLVCLSGMLWCMICMLTPQFLRYYQIDHFKNAGQKLNDFTQLALDSNASLGVFILFLLLAKTLLFIIFCTLLLQLVKRVKNPAIVMGIGIGSIGLTILLMWYFHFDLTIFFLRTLSAL